MQPKIKEMQQWIANNTKLFINGRSVKGGGSNFVAINPSTEQELCSYQMANQANVDEAVSSAHSAFSHKSWADITREERASYLRQVAAVIREHEEELAILETLLNGKTYQESLYDDMPDSSRVFEYYAGWIDKISSDLLPVEKGFLNYTKREPLGVCALIVPWNFPLLMACWKIAPALAMGNTIVVKPSEYTPYSLLYAVEKISEKTSIPKGVINVVIGGADIGEHLTKHPDINGISFTGSTQVGRKVLEASAQSNLKKVNIELGGKSPNIFFEDTPNLEQAISRQYSAMFSHKGEKCSEPTRLVVHESIYQQTLDGLKQMATNVVFGDPFDKKTTQGAQCHKGQYEKILKYIEIGHQSSAKFLAGQEAQSSKAMEKGFYIKPTIFCDVDPDDPIAQEEIFGPVLCVIPFKTEEEAVKIANNTVYGLAAGFYTADIARVHRVADQIDAGQIFVNKYGCYDFASPFGGFRQSGWGKAMAKHSLDEYTKTKSIWIAL